MKGLLDRTDGTGIADVYYNILDLRTFLRFKEHILIFLKLSCACTTLCNVVKFKEGQCLTNYKVQFLSFLS